MNKSWETRDIYNICMDGAMLFFFCLFPWAVISISSYFTFQSSAFMMPFRLMNVYSSVNTTLSYYSTASDVNGYYSGTLLYMFTWYVIPAFFITAVIRFLVNHDSEQLAKTSFYGMIASLITTGIFAIVRMVILNNITQSMNSYSLGFLSGTISSYFQLGIGWWLIFLLSIFGAFMPVLVRANLKSGASVPDGLAGVVTGGVYPTGGSNSGGTNSRPASGKWQTQPAMKRSQQNESTGDLIPAITLSGGDNRIEVYSLPFTIGRNQSESDGFIPDKTVSRKHCMITSTEGQIALVDLESTKGTFLFGEQLEPNVYYGIEDGDTVRIGDVTLTVRFDPILIKKFQTAPETGAVAEEPQVPEIPVPEPAVQAEPAAASTYTADAVEASEYTEIMDESYDEPIEPKMPEYSEPAEPVKPSYPEPEVEESTVYLGSIGDDQSTVALDYNGVDSAFPYMLLTCVNFSQSSPEMIIITKTPFYLGSIEGVQDGVVDGALAAKGISRRHACIERINGSFYVTDLNSTNGVRLNGDLLTPGEAVPVGIEDRIEIGDREYSFGRA